MREQRPAPAVRRGSAPTSGTRRLRTRSCGTPARHSPSGSSPPPAPDGASCPTERGLPLGQRMRDSAHDSSPTGAARQRRSRATAQHGNGAARQAQHGNGAARQRRSTATALHGNGAARQRASSATRLPWPIDSAKLLKSAKAVPSPHRPNLSRYLKRAALQRTARPSDSTCWRWLSGGRCQGIRADRPTPSRTAAREGAP
jgi:hypothetical protein